MTLDEYQKQIPVADNLPVLPTDIKRRVAKKVGESLQECAVQATAAGLSLEQIARASLDGARSKES